MITAQGTDCVITLEQGALTIVRFPGATRGRPLAGVTTRVLPAAAVTSVDVEPPRRWRHGRMRLGISPELPGSRAEVLDFKRAQQHEVLELAAALTRSPVPPL